MDWKIGILCAADSELEPFLALLQHCATTESAMLRVYEGELAGISVVALYSGVCKVNAAVAAQLLIDQYGVNAVINAGTAGGMDDLVRVFDTVVSTRAVYHDVAEDILTEFHPWMPSVYFDADKTLLDAARQAAQTWENPVRFGVMATGESFITDSGRAAINEAFSPLTVDMETAAVAHVCYVNRTPFLAVRTATDTASHSAAADFEENCEKASTLSADFVVELFKALRNA